MDRTQTFDDVIEYRMKLDEMSDTSRILFEQRARECGIAFALEEIRSNEEYVEQRRRGGKI